MAEIRADQCEAIREELERGPQTTAELSDSVTLPKSIVEARIRERPDLFARDGERWRTA